MKSRTPSNRQQDREEFSLAFASNFDDVCRFVERRAATRDVEAVVGEAFLIAWKSWAKRPADPLDVRPWLFGIARNATRSVDRHETRRSAVELKGVALAPPAPDVFDSVESDLTMKSALLALSPSDREVIVLVCWEDLSTEGLAIALGVGPTAARVRLYRARKRLTSLLAKPQGNALSGNAIELRTDALGSSQKVKHTP
jgi:RNA polymerase sigma-70 factor, ECF subfamily